MVQYSLRALARFAILLPGIIIAYFSVRTVFPFVDHKLRLPDAFSILITYALAAYVLVPALIRLFRILHPPKHLPVYCVTPDGFASDPLNIGIIGTRAQLIAAMEQTGWHMADPHRWRYVIRQILSIVYDWSYPTAPVSNLYLFGRKQDIAFEIPIEGGHGSRHHIRFWATAYDSRRPLTVHSIYRPQRRTHLRGGELLWVGAASLDTGLGFIRHNMQITHMIHPDTDQERELIIKKMRAAKLVDKVKTVPLGRPYFVVNRVISGYLHTDGKMTVVSLR